MKPETRYTTITWEEYVRLCRDSERLEFLEAQHARRSAGNSLSGMVDKALDAKQAMQTILARAVKRQFPPHAGGQGGSADRRSEPPVAADYRPLDWTDG